ncbi:hypothetical protein Tco_0385071 [Tanacetum coccineum]
MSFGLCNAPATFMRLMNDILRPHIDDFVVVYLDDILKYSQTEEEHLEHLHKVDPEKVKAIKDWPRPSSVIEICSFIGACQYLRKFIRYFSVIAVPLHALTKINSKFEWTKKHEDTLYLEKGKEAVGVEAEAVGVEVGVGTSPYKTIDEARC